MKSHQCSGPAHTAVTSTLERVSTGLKGPSKVAWSGSDWVCWWGPAKCNASGWREQGQSAVPPMLGPGTLASGDPQVMGLPGSHESKLPATWWNWGRTGQKFSPFSKNCLDFFHMSVYVQDLLLIT